MRPLRELQEWDTIEALGKSSSYGTKSLHGRSSRWFKEVVFAGERSVHYSFSASPEALGWPNDPQPHGTVLAYCYNPVL